MNKQRERVQHDKDAPVKESRSAYICMSIQAI